MKYVKTEPTPYLTLYSLEGKEDKFSRMSMYNKIMFFSLKSVTSKKAKTVIVTNEIKTGGIIITNENFLEKVIRDFSKKNPGYLIKSNIQAKSIGLPNKMIYCSFDMIKK